MSTSLKKTLSVLWLAFCLASASAACASQPHLTNERQAPKTDTITVPDLKKWISSGKTFQLLDVRLLKDRNADPHLLPKAVWQDPKQVDTWAKNLSKSTPVVVYCVYGHQVSQQVVSRLHQLGYSVQQLAGGLEAWKAAGGQTVPFP